MTSNKTLVEKKTKIYKYYKMISNLVDNKIKLNRKKVPLTHRVGTNNESIFEHIFDNIEQDGVIIEYLHMKFTNNDNKYKCITEVIDRIEINYNLNDITTNIITMTSKDMLYLYDFEGSNKGDIFRRMITKGRFPLIFNNNPSHALTYLPTPDDSSISYSINVICKIDTTIDIRYTQLTSESHQYTEKFVQEYHDYKQMESLHWQATNYEYIELPILEYESDGFIVDLGKDGNILTDVWKINGLVTSKYYKWKFGHSPSNSRYIHIKDPSTENFVILQVTNLIDEYKLASFIKRQLVFIDGYLLDEAGNKLQNVIVQDDVLDGLDKDIIGVAIEL